MTTRKRTVLGEIVQRTVLEEKENDENGSQCLKTNISMNVKSIFNDSSYYSPNENSFSQPFFSLRRQDTSSFYKTPVPLKFKRRRSSWDNEDEDYFVKHQIPDLVLLQICSYLNKKDLVNIMRTCRRFHGIANHPSFWSFLNLADKHLTDHSLNLILDRRVQVLRMYNARIEILPNTFRNAILPSRLTHLDLSNAKFETIDSLVNILRRCYMLVCLSLESCEVNDHVCIEISKNSRLKILNMIMVNGLTARGISAITSQCIHLNELNLGWTRLNYEATRTFILTAPTTIERLNFSGMGRTAGITWLDDDAVSRLCQTCTNLIELDLSDNDVITERSVRVFRDMPRLKKLNLARCYGIEPNFFMTLGHLEELNIFDCVTNESRDVIKAHYLHMRVNEPESIFSTVARPTVGGAISSIWGMRTRDIY